MHKSHPRIIARLRRAEGHTCSIITMMEEGRPCLDLAQQLHAVEAAIAKAKKELIHDHIEHCLEDGEHQGKERHDMKTVLGELKQLAKYL